MKISGILETVLYADDLDAIEAFYSGILNLDKITRDQERHIFYRCGDQVLLIFNPDITSKAAKPGALPVPPHGAHGQGHICFKATHDEIVSWREKLQSAGVTIDSDFQWPGGGRSIYFRDPAGNCLEFAEPRIWGLREHAINE